MERRLLQDIIQWDVRNWAKALLFWEKAVAWHRIPGPCLEIGAREGGLSLWLAQKGMKVICSDLERTEATASALHKKYGVGPRIQYLDIDATNIPFENHFGLVVFKSVLGALGYGGAKNRQTTAMNEIFKALKPGGKLLFAENLKATPVHAWLRRHVVGGYARSWRYVAIQEMESFLRPFSDCQLHTTGFVSLFGKTETQRDFLALVDQAILDKVVPKTWRYIAYGVATKRGGLPPQLPQEDRRHNPMNADKPAE
jgi:SAM-dependent methyltransferase